MRTDAATRLLVIQRLRAGAVLAVVATHVVYMLNNHQDVVGTVVPEQHHGLLNALGGVVDLFFIMSGFVLCLAVRKLSGRRDAGIFFLHRASRIAPSYLVVTALFVGVAGLVGGAYQVSWRSIANAVLYVPVFDRTAYTTPPVFVGWTLSFEFTFYLLLTAAVFLGRARTTLWLLPFFLALAGIGQMVGGGWYLLSFLTNAIFVDFGLGALACWAWLRGWIRPHRMWAVAAAVASAAMVAVAVLGDGRVADHEHTVDNTLSLLRVAVYGIPMTVVFCWALQVELRRHTWVTRGADRVGDASYSIYLTHVFVLAALGFVLDRVDGPVGLAPLILLVSTATAIVAGWVFFRLVEDPVSAHLRRWIDSAFPPRRSPAPVPAAVTDPPGGKAAAHA